MAFSRAFSFPENSRSMSDPIPDEVPRTVYYIDIDNYTDVPLESWIEKIEYLSPASYVLFVMNSEVYKYRKRKNEKPHRLITNDYENNVQTSILVGGTFKEEADHIIEGHLRQMIRMKKLKRDYCNGSRMRVTNTGYEFYDGNERTITKRCQPDASDAINFAVASGDNDFDHIFTELRQYAAQSGVEVTFVRLPKNFDELMWLE